MSDGGVVAADQVAGRGEGRSEEDTAGSAAGLEVPHDGREGDDSIVDGSFEVLDEKPEPGKGEEKGPEQPAVVSEPEGFSQVGECCGGEVLPSNVVSLSVEKVVVAEQPAKTEVYFSRQDDAGDWDYSSRIEVARRLDSHKVNGLNEALEIGVFDEPGAGGANHHYAILVPDRGWLGIAFQNGPISEAGVNGISNEALLAIVEDRLRGFQSGPYACEENKKAWAYVRSALQMLKLRTEQREARGVEGTSQV